MLSTEQLTKHMDLSDAEILRIVSSGMVTKGLYMNKELNGSISPRQNLVNIPDDLQFCFPSIPETSETFELINHEVSEQFERILKNGGRSLAITFFCAIYKFFSGKKEDIEKLNTSSDQYFKKWSSRELSITTFVPTASVQIESTNRCKLSTSALRYLQKLENCFSENGLSDYFVRHCEKFFLEFGSHYFIGTYHFGGIWKDSRTEEIKESKDGTGKMKHSSTLNIKYDKIGGSPSADEISSWKRSLVRKPYNWCVIDKEESHAMNYRAVWQLIDAENFKTTSEFSTALEDAWKQITGLKIKPEIGGIAFIIDTQIKKIEKNVAKDIFLFECTENLSVKTGRKTTVSDMIRLVKTSELSNTRTSDIENTERETSCDVTGEDVEIFTSKLFEKYLNQIDNSCEAEDNIDKFLEKEKFTTANFTTKQKVSEENYDAHIVSYYECHPNCKDCPKCKWCPVCCKGDST